jgi:hypothetical protein
MASKLKETGEVIEAWFIIAQSLDGAERYRSAYVDARQAERTINQMLSRIVSVGGYRRDGIFNAYAALLVGKIVKTKSGEKLIVREGQKPCILFT